MELIKLYFKILGSLLWAPLHHEDPPVLDDGPSHDSMHFMESDEAYRKCVPASYLQYDFSINTDECDFQIGSLSMEIMHCFCGSRQVLTRVHSERDWPQKMKHPPESFTVRYQRFLEHMHSSLSIHAPDERTLFLLGNGFDPLFFWASRDLDTVDSIFFNTYILPQGLNITNAKEAAAAVAAGQYDVWFDFSEWGPSALFVTFNPETVDVGALQSIIEAVCAEHNILFQNPIL